MKNKQEVTSNNFSFESVKNVTKVLGADNNDENEVSICQFKIFIDDKSYSDFYKLMLNYATENEIFNFTHDRFFKISVLFLKNIFEKEGFFKIHKKGFEEMITRPGRRKKHDRYVDSRIGKNIYFKVDEVSIKTYYSLMYSYILKYDKNTILDKKHSRAYFFVDYVNHLKKYKKQLMKYN